jgi:hypothetical protein
MEASQWDGKVSLRPFDRYHWPRRMYARVYAKIIIMASSKWHQKMSPRFAALSQTGVSEY